MFTLDHVTLVVSNYARSKVFYEKALAPLGIKADHGLRRGVRVRPEQKPDFWIGTGPTSFQKPEQLTVITPTHIAFATPRRSRGVLQGRARCGRQDFGAPGVRAHYHPNYYGAFVLDPDGHDIEAVFRGSRLVRSPASSSVTPAGTATLLPRGAPLR